MLAPALSRPLAANAATAGRIGWLDAARGIGIVLVVVGHALGGLIDAAPASAQEGFRDAFFAIYTFHMPLFLALSGLLVASRLEKGPARFFRDLLPSIVWPYFLWSIVQHTMIYALGSLVNNPVHGYWPTILALPWTTVSQFWFLHALFWMHVLAIAFVPRVGREGLVLLALALKILALVLPLPAAVRVVCLHFVFYAVGVWLSPAGIERFLLGWHWPMKALGFPLLAATAIAATLLAVGNFGADIPFQSATSTPLSNLAGRLPASVAAACGVVAVIGLASLPAIGGQAWLVRLGQLTMPIFLLHVMFTAGTRIVLTRLGLVTDPHLLLPLLIAAGLAGPIAVAHAARRFRLERYLGF